MFKMSGDPYVNCESLFCENRMKIGEVVKDHTKSLKITTSDPQFQPSLVTKHLEPYPFMEASDCYPELNICYMNRF